MEVGATLVLVDGVAVWEFVMAKAKALMTVDFTAV